MLLENTTSMENTILETVLSLWYHLLQIINTRNINLKKRIQHKRREMRRKIFFLQRKAYNEFNQKMYNVNFSMLPLLNKPRHRSIGKKIRSSDFWDRIVLCTFKDEDWLENFRMTKSTFFYICETLHNELKTYDKAGQSISVERKVAVAIYKLASCCEYRVVGCLFGIHKSTVHKCVYAFVKAVNKILLPKYLIFPSEAEAISIADEVKRRTNVEQVFGFIDGTHIPILPPSEGYRDFVNRKGWPSLILQAVVDHNYMFRDVSMNFPGSVHDAVVFKESSLYKKSQDILPNKRKTINGMDIPLMILGDPAYPLLPWILKGYTGSLTAEEESFNCYLSSARICVENAFGRLKARWRCLLKRQDIKYTFVPKVVSACCVLHNIVESKKEQFRGKWFQVAEEYETRYPQPNSASIQVNNDAKSVRDHLKNYMANTYPLRKSLLRKNR